MSSKRVLITAGGTGGHLYPAQALAQQLKKLSSPLDVLFVAGGLASNRYFDRSSFPFHEIVSTPLLSKNPIKTLKGLSHLILGVKQSIAILKRYRPDVVVGFGSYFTVPILLAAKWLKIPIILHEANSIPGKANKWLAPLATTIAYHFPSTAAHFKQQSVEVGLPLREGYHLNAISRDEALAYYRLQPDRQILLVCGGSQGARAINQLIQECLPVIRNLSLQVIHLTGDEKKAAELVAVYREYEISAVVKPFESQMQMAWRAASGFVGRSGASTMAEAVEFEVPGILIPYPHATDNHQEKNADFLVETVGSAWKLIEQKTTPKKLSETLCSFFQPEQMAAFQKALKDYKKRPHQLTLCQLVLNFNSSK